MTALARGFHVAAPLVPAVVFFSGAWLVAQVLTHAGFPLLLGKLVIKYVLPYLRICVDDLCDIIFKGMRGFGLDVIIPAALTIVAGWLGRGIRGPDEPSLWR